jgi:hypothetical protein
MLSLPMSSQRRVDIHRAAVHCWFAHVACGRVCRSINCTLPSFLHVLGDGLTFSTSYIASGQYLVSLFNPVYEERNFEITSLIGDIANVSSCLF